MACIDDLFDLILEIIFNKLPLHYRLKCKEVSKRWYKLLMTRAIYRLDRHIYLSDCVIEPNRPPMSVFMKAKFPYDILTLKADHILKMDNTKDPLFVDYNETLALWQHLGQTMTEIHFDISCLYSAKFYEILYEMPHIQDMSSTNELETVARRLSEMRVKYPERTFLPNVKTIKMSSCNIDSTRHDSRLYWTMLRCVTPACTELICDQACIYEYVPLESILDALQKIKVKCLKFEFDYDDDEFIDTQVMETLLEGDDLPGIQALNLKYDMATIPSSDSLKEVLDKHPNINDVTLKCDFCDFSLIPFTFTQLTDLNLGGKDENPLTMGSLKWMEPLVNLRALELNIYNGEDICVFGHEIVNLPKMEKFSVELLSMRCSECLTALTNSFPNLNEFFCYFDVDDLQILQSMFTNWRHLRTMLVHLERITLENIGKLVENLTEQRLCLRNLHIYSHNALKCSGDDFLKMSQVFPDLTTIEIADIQDSTDIEDVIKGIVPAFKDLTSLEIRNKKLSSSKFRVSKTFFEYLEQNGHSLRRLVIPDLSFDAELGAVWLFQHLDQLCFFNDDDRRLWMKRSIEESQQMENPCKKLKI